MNLPDAILYKLLNWLNLANQSLANTAVKIQFEDF